MNCSILMNLLVLLFHYISSNNVHTPRVVYSTEENSEINVKFEVTYGLHIDK